MYLWPLQINSSLSESAVWCIVVRKREGELLKHLTVSLLCSSYFFQVSYLLIDVGVWLREADNWGWAKTSQQMHVLCAESDASALQNVFGSIIIL